MSYIPNIRDVTINCNQHLTNQLLIHHSYFSINWGKTSFSCIAHTIWNGLLLNTRLSLITYIYKCHLKTIYTAYLQLPALHTYRVLAWLIQLQLRILYSVHLTNCLYFFIIIIIIIIITTIIITAVKWYKYYRLFKQIISMGINQLFVHMKKWLTEHIQTTL